MKQYQNRDWLIKKYCVEKLSCYQISKLCEVSKPTIRNWLIKFGIDRRTNSESRKRQSNKNKGKPLSKKHREKLSKSHKGKIPWNKGLTKETDKRVKKSSETHKGIKFTKEHKIKLSDAAIFRIKKDLIRGIKYPTPFFNINTKAEKNGNWKGGQIKAICKTCDKIFDIRKDSIINNGNFCSRKCHGKWMSKNIIGKNHPNYIDGKGNWPHPLEFNKKLKKQIRKRDDYQCQECGIKENGKAHDCHHIDYDKTNNEDWNLITLCDSCHPKTNFNRKYWQNYFEFQMSLTSIPIPT